MQRMKLAHWSIAFVIAASLFEGSASAQQNWPIKRFKVEQSEDRYVLGLLKDWIADGTIERFRILDQRARQELSLSDIELTDAQAAEIERYLGRVAQQFEDWGFPPPALKPVVKTDDGQQAYQIYVYDWGEGRGGPAHADTNCPTNPSSPNIIAFNTRNEKFYKNGALTPEAYQDLAHELFHTVQNNSQMSRDLCQRYNDNKVSGWFTEGSAEAIGIDTMRLLRGKTAYPKNAYRWGLRGYYRDLQDVTKSDGYATHGLWRYLAEAKHTLETQGGIRPTAKFTETDYSYLAQYLDVTFPGKPDRDNELGWFNIASIKVFGVRGHVMFRNFTPTLAGYVRERSKRPPADRPKIEEEWLEHLFGSCREHVLTDAKPYSTALVRHQRISAKCIRIKPDVQDQVDVTITQYGAAEEYFRALTIGRLGGAQVGPGMVAALEAAGPTTGVNQPGERLVSWKFRIPGGESHVFVITNAAADLPWTKTHEGRFQIQMAAISNSMTKATPQGIPPSSGSKRAGKKSTGAKRDSGSPESAGQEAIDELAGDVTAGLVSLSGHSSTWTSVGRYTDDSGCSPGLAAINLCGPSLKLRLEFSPGMVGDTTMTTGAGGELGQFMSMMQGMAAADPEAVSAGWLAAGESAFEQSGSSVTLNVGLVDYGFSGTLNHAHIVANQGGEYSPFESLEPNLSMVDGWEVYRPSGTVTIEEYGPHVLRGSFSGVLVDKLGWNGEGPLPVHGPISGRFNVLDPWRSDKRFAVIRTEDPAESAMEDLRQAVPGLAGFMQGTTPTGGESGGGPDGPSSGGSSGGGALECDCSCDTIKELSDECRIPCFMQILQCALGEDG